MTSVGKASANAVGALECQELRLGWEHSALSGCLIHSSSSYCHFLQAGKLAVDRGWAINVGEYKWKFVLNDTLCVFKVIIFIQYDVYAAYNKVTGLCSTKRNLKWKKRELSACSLILSSLLQFYN